MLISQEALSLLFGFVNKPNYRIWSGENLHMTDGTPMHGQKVTVWYVLLSGGVIGPYFIENDEVRQYQSTGCSVVT